MNAATKAAILDQIAQDSVPDTLNLWPEVRRLASRRTPSRATRTRVVFAGMAAAALVALVVGRGGSAARAAADSRRQRGDRRDPGGRLQWSADPRGGQTSVIHTTGTEWTRPADDPSASASITDVLARYSQDKQCMSAQLAGERTVAGHAVYQINVTPKPTACGIAVGDYRVGQVRQGTGDDASQTVARMQISVDKQTFLPLKTEVRDGSGTVLDRSEVSFLEYDVALADASFSYTPPAGARVSTFSGGSGADVKRALCERGTPPAPHK